MAFLVEGSMKNPPTQAQVDAVTPEQLDAAQEAKGITAQDRRGLDHENRLRALEGKPAIDMKAFRKLLPVLAMIMLTQLDGSPVWVESTQVQIVKLGARECGPSAKSVVRVLSTTLCVKESTDEVRGKIERAK